MTCPTCGHPVKFSRQYRTALDWLRGRPPYWRCEAVDETDMGNGMAGFGPCGCRDRAHEKKPAPTDP